MDFPGNSQSDSGKLEQIASQFFLKALHIVLDSRIPSLQLRRDRSSVAQVRKSDKWFNLVLGDRPAALDKLHSWHRNVMDSMIIDIILVHLSPAADINDDASAARASSSVETVIERWVVQYETPLVMAPQSIELSTSYQKIYKKSIILLHSLYSQMRLLPAYRISRQLISSRSSSVDLIYKVSSFSDPFSSSEKEMMKEYRFVPIEMPPGHLSVSVAYHSKLSDFNLGASITLPPRIITDYVGSPTTDPMRFFPTPEKGVGVHTTLFPVRAPRPPLSALSERPHSWTSGFHKPAHSMQNRSLGGTPPSNRVSSGVHDFQSTRTDIHGSSQLSPPFSPSTSPSTPTYISGGNSMQTHVRSGTAPVSIPSSMTSIKYLSSNFSDPSKISLPPFSPKSTKRHPSSPDSLSGIMLYRRAEGLRTGESPSSLTSNYSGQKVVKDNRDDSGRFSGLLSLSGSPRSGFSRSPSRLSSQDDLDDLDLSCPFDFDDVNSSGPQSSHSLDRRKALNFTSQSTPIGRKSQDAAVGVLVHMLRTAPPLRQDPSCYMSVSEGRREGGVESEFSLARRTSDALDELRTYKEMKDLLVSKKEAA